MNASAPFHYANQARALVALSSTQVMGSVSNARAVLPPMHYRHHDEFVLDQKSGAIVGTGLEADQTEPVTPFHDRLTSVSGVRPGKPADAPTEVAEAPVVKESERSAPEWQAVATLVPGPPPLLKPAATTAPATQPEMAAVPIQASAGSGVEPPPSSGSVEDRIASQPQRQTDASSSIEPTAVRAAVHRVARSAMFDTAKTTDKSPSTSAPHEIGRGAGAPDRVSMQRLMAWIAASPVDETPTSPTKPTIQRAGQVEYASAPAPPSARMAPAAPGMPKGRPVGRVLTRSAATESASPRQSRSAPRHKPAPGVPSVKEHRSTEPPRPPQVIREVYTTVRTVDSGRPAFSRGFVQRNYLGHALWRRLR